MQQQQQQQQQQQKQRAAMPVAGMDENTPKARPPVVSAVVVGSCGPPPKVLEEYVAPEALRMTIAANTDLDSRINAAGHRWSLDLDRGGAKVWSSASGVSSARLFRVSIVLEITCETPWALDLHECMRWLSLYERRRFYDDSLTSTRYLRRYDERNGAQMDVVRYTTKTEAGGLISPRVFTDVRVFFPERGAAPGRLGTTEVFGASVFFDEKKTPLPPHRSEGTGDATGDATGEGSFASPVKLSAHEARCTAARNLPGGGIRMVATFGERAGSDSSFQLRMTMTALSELGGWLPTSIVNSATTSVFKNIAVSFAAHLGTIDGVACRVVV